MREIDQDLVAYSLQVDIHEQGSGTWRTFQDALLMGEGRDSDPGILLADRGYDSDAIRQDIRDRCSQLKIPTKRNRWVQHSVQRLI